MEIEKSESTEQPIDNKKISIEGSINWKMFINLETKETQVVCNNSTSNEGAMLALCHQMVDQIIKRNKEDMNSESSRRLRVTQFELQKLFTQCLNYIVQNMDKELTQKEEAK